MIGKTLSHYEILEPLGAGGMGEVYRARDTRLGREVALKVLSLGRNADPESRKRFEREAQILAGLNHTNIVTVFSVEECEGVLFLTMELVEGTTLSQRLSDGLPHPEEMCDLLLPLVDALSSAHQRGVVHRDLKPGNVMITPEGKVKLLDFGVAKLTESLSPEARTEVLTQAGVVAGTPSYMSPEQVRGETLDVRSDLFSLGVVIYEMVTGRLPFPGQSVAETMSSILRDKPVRCSELDGTGIERLATVVERCLEKDPDRRYQTAAELLRDLEALKRKQSETADLEPEALEKGRRAFASQSWSEAYELLSQADDQLSLSGSDLEMLGEAAWWSGKRDEQRRVLERALPRYLEEGNEPRAGFVATVLAEEYFFSGSNAVAAGWLKRAERLFAKGESAEKGYWNRLQVRFHRDDPERCLEISKRTIEIGRQFKDPNLEAQGLMDMGYSLVVLGRVSEGMPLIDEAMAAVVGGQLSPQTTGRIYCNMMGVCDQLADYRRASEWSAAAQNWCEPHSNSVYPGICQVHRAGVLRVKGDWEAAEAQARKACEILGHHPHQVGEAVYEIGEIQLRRGDFDGARASFRRAHEAGRDPMPGLARLRLLEGKVEAARKLIDRALEETKAPLARARLLSTRIEISLSEGDADSAEAAISELEEIATTFGCEIYRAAATHGRGAVLLQQGNPGEAAAELRRAWLQWKELDLPYEGAQTRLLMGEAYRAAGNPEDARLEIQAAQSTFERLGAVKDSEGAVAALSRLQ